MILLQKIFKVHTFAFTCLGSFGPIVLCTCRRQPAAVARRRSQRKQFENITAHAVGTLSRPHHCALHAADNNNITSSRERTSLTIVHASYTSMNV